MYLQTKQEVISNNEVLTLKKDFLVFTSTQYWEDEISNIRLELFFKTLDRLLLLWIKITIADSSTNQNFINRLKEYENLWNWKIFVLYWCNESMWEKRRRCLKEWIEHFKNTKYYIWTEPEKYDLFSNTNISKIINPILRWKADLVVPKRNKKWQMPEFFDWIEQRWMNRANKLIKKNNYKWKSNEELDLWFWPKIFNNKWINYYLGYNIDWNQIDLWDQHIIPTMQAVKDQVLRIMSVPINYTYDQKEIELESKLLKEKRLQQYKKIKKSITDNF